MYKMSSVWTLKIFKKSALSVVFHHRWEDHQVSFEDIDIYFKYGNLGFSIICKDLHDHECGQFPSIPIDCDSVIDWIKQWIESGWNDSCICSRHFLALLVLFPWGTDFCGEYCNFYHFLFFSASFAHIAHPIGSILSGPLCDKIGRRKAILMVSIPIFIAWIMLGFAQSFPVVCVGFMLLGFCMGLKEAPALTYVSEIRWI